MNNVREFGVFANQKETREFLACRNLRADELAQYQGESFMGIATDQDQDGYSMTIAIHAPMKENDKPWAELSCWKGNKEVFSDIVSVGFANMYEHTHEGEVFRVGLWFISNQVREIISLHHLTKMAG